MFYPMNFIQKCRRLVMVPLVLLAFAVRLSAQENAPSEYQLKAAFLFNFGKFVTWPADDFSQENAPLVIGVFEDNPFHDDLKDMIDGKSIKGHPVVFRMVTTPADAKKCHILFVSASAQKDAAGISGALQGANVLTVTENMAHFTHSGYAINFVMEESKVRFEINNAAAAQAGLTISSKLMALAKPPEP